MIGAMTMSVSAICRNSWICWMSLVLRVISDGVPKRFISRAENACTRVNTAARMSAPAPMATRDAQYTATIGDDADRQGDGQHDRAGRQDVVEVRP